MSELFRLTFPSALTGADAFSSASTDSGNLSWDSGDLGGSSGRCKLIFPGSTANKSGLKTFTALSSETDLRFQIIQSGIVALSMVGGSFHEFVQVLSDTQSNGRAFVFVFNNYGTMQIGIQGRKDDGSSTPQAFANLGSATIIDVHIHRSTDGSTADGWIKLYLDGSLAATTASYINYDNFDFDGIKVGATGGVDSTTTGTFYFGQIALRNDSTPIEETNTLPVITSVDPQYAVNGVTKTIIGLVLTDPDGGDITMTIACTWGTLNLVTPGTLEVTGEDTNTLELIGTPTELNTAFDAGLTYHQAGLTADVITLDAVDDGALDAEQKTIAITMASMIITADNMADLNATFQSLMVANVLVEDVILTVKAIDDAGNITEQSTTLHFIEGDGEPLSLDIESLQTIPGGKHIFYATGGVYPYIFSLYGDTTGFSSINSVNGLFTAGPFRGEVTVRVTDSDSPVNIVDVPVIVGEERINWTAYNDFAWGTGHLETNITKFTSPVGGTGLPSEGLLIDYATGENTPITMTITGGQFISGNENLGDDVNAGDALGIFFGKVTTKGCLVGVNDINDHLTIKLSDCDPTKFYDLTFYNHRSAYGWDRAATIIISGAAVYLNASSIAIDNPNTGDYPGGVLFNGPGFPVTRLPADNPKGYVARFRFVQPDSNGDLFLVSNFDGSESERYWGKYASAMRVIESEVIPTIPWQPSTGGELGVVIGTSDKTAVISQASIEITQELHTRSMAKFTVISESSILQFYRPIIGDLITIIYRGEVIFAGTIDRIEQRREKGLKSVLFQDIEAVSWEQICDRHLVTKSYDSKSLNYIVNDILGDELQFEGLLPGDIQTGPVLEKAVWNFTSVAEVFNELAQVSGFEWYISTNKLLHFVPGGTASAPLSITTDEHYESLSVTRERGDYRNIQYIKAGQDETDSRVETFKGDGETRTFILSFPIATIATIKVNSVAKTFSIRGQVEGTSDWYYQLNADTVSQDLGDTALSTSDTLEVTYTGYFPVLVIADDPNEIAMRASIENGSGIYEAVEDRQDLNVASFAYELAVGVLRRKGFIANVIQFTTTEINQQETIWRAGQVVSINLPAYGLSGEYLISRIQFNMLGDLINTFIFTIECLDGEALGGWAEFWMSIAKRGRRFSVRENEIATPLIHNTEPVSMSDSSSITQNSSPCGIIDFSSIGYFEIC